MSNGGDIFRILYHPQSPANPRWSMKMANKNPEYDIYLPVWDKPEPWFEFSEGQRQTFVGNNPWRFSSSDKKESIHSQASSCEAVVTVYPNAIAVGGPAGTSDAGSNGILGIAIFIVGIALSIMMLMVTKLHPFSLLFVFMLVSSLFGLSFAIRMTFFSFRDLPALFNKASRTVTITKPRPVPFLKFWQPGIVDRVTTYSWDAVQVRTYKTMQMMGETSRESYNLTLLCADSDKPHLFKDFTYLGYVETWEDAPLWRLWEHIRRYMEEDGPPLQPGEMLRTSGFGKLPKFPQHLIDAAGGEALSVEELEKLTDYAQETR